MMIPTKPSAFGIAPLSNSALPTNWHDTDLKSCPASTGRHRVPKIFMICVSLMMVCLATMMVTGCLLSIRVVYSVLANAKNQYIRLSMKLAVELACINFSTPQPKKRAQPLTVFIRRLWRSIALAIALRFQKHIVLSKRHLSQPAAKMRLKKYKR